MQRPLIIQGGMGVGVSGWQLARAVSIRGQLGVVAGTALATTFARRLQQGDIGGHLRRALEAFPASAMARRQLEKYYRPSPGKAGAFKRHSLPAARMPRSLLELTIVASFAEVFLAKAQHRGIVGLNLLEKVQLPTLPTLFGAMLAGVDFVLMGAGIPRAIPYVLDRLAKWEPAELALDVARALPGEKFTTSLDPAAVLPDAAVELKRPRFLAVISSAVLAKTLVLKSSGRVDGFVVEGPSAGGHNAPPRGAMELSPRGEPVYGPRDDPELDKIRDLGRPFWLAGSFGRPGRLREALALGAAGIQVGTAFAFCDESGIRADLKQRVIRSSHGGDVEARTDPRASPTGFPLKVVQMTDTLSERDVFEARPKVCDLGYLRQAYRSPDGRLGYRCPGEPERDFLKKGGDPQQIEGRKCVCNGLLATVGLAQVQKRGYVEPPLLTAGLDVRDVARFVNPGRDSYSAADVLDRLLDTTSPPGGA